MDPGLKRGDIALAAVRRAPECRDSVAKRESGIADDAVVFVDLDPKIDTGRLHFLKRFEVLGKDTGTDRAGPIEDDVQWIPPIASARIGEARLAL